MCVIFYIGDTVCDMICSLTCKLKLIGGLFGCIFFSFLLDVPSNGVYFLTYEYLKKFLTPEGEW